MKAVAKESFPKGNCLNGNKTYHLEHLSGLWPEMVQNVSETTHLEDLGGLGPDMVQNGTKNGNQIDHL